MRAGVAVLLALLATGSSAIGAAERIRRLTESVTLPNYGGDWYTVATSINNRGEIAGYADGPEGERVAWIRTRRGYETIADRALALDISNRGHVVGVRFPCDECPGEGFVWSRDGSLQNLGSFWPFAVNDSGDMSGVCELESQACVMRDGLVTAIAEPGSVANGINAKGHAVGEYGDNRAFHVMPDWRFADVGRGVAVDINDRRQIAGHRWMSFGERGERAVVTVWSSRGVARSPAREVSTGEAINSKGWVIANAWDDNEEAYSFVWNPATNTRVMLTSATGEWVIVDDINDRGDVVGTAGLSPVIWRVRQRHLTR